MRLKLNLTEEGDNIACVAVCVDAYVEIKALIHLFLFLH